MAFAFALIVSMAIGMLIWAVVDKIVGLFMDGWSGWVASLVIGGAAVWIISDWYFPLLVKAFGG